MNILLVNDDGVNAPGIRILKEVLDSIGKVVIVAPSEEKSTTGHSLTLDHTLRLNEISKDIYSCNGFPADCALMGIAYVYKEIYKIDKIDLVISGINRGANLGQDIFYSGTVAGAREACFRGIPSIAVSSSMDFKNITNEDEYYYTASNFIKDLVLSKLFVLDKPLSFLNINVPWLPIEKVNGVKYTSLGFRNYSQDIEQRVDFRGRKYFWIGGIYQGYMNIPDSDCSAIEQNYISVSPISFLDTAFINDLSLDKFKFDLSKKFRIWPNIES